MSDDSDLTEDCYTDDLSAEIAVGDICVSVPLPDAGAVPDFDANPEVSPKDLFLPGRWDRVIVLRVFEGFVVVAPVSTAEQASDRENWEMMVETGRDNFHWVRLPPLEGEWEEAAVAFLFIPHTVPAELLLERRVATLTSTAQRVFAQRVARAFLPV
jgi:hypothetical protein